MEVSMRWHGDKVSRRQQAAGAKGLKLGAEHVLTVSNTKVPHQEGTLERSGATDVDESGQRASVYYDTPYAAAQHERLENRHDNGRQAKYLETTLLAEQDTVAGIVAQALRAGLEG